MKLFKKIAAIILCVAMAVPFASCGADTSWVAKTDDTTINAGLYMYYLTAAYGSALNKVEDRDKNVLKQTIDGVDAAKWIEDEAMNQIKRYIVVQNLAAEKGVELSEEYAQTAQQYASLYWANAQDTYTKNGVGYESLLKALRTNNMYAQLFYHIYGEGGEKEIPAQEVKTHFSENYAKTKEIAISLASIKGEMRSEETQKKLKEMAEDYKKRIEAGESIDTLYKEHFDYDVKLAAEESGKTVEELLGDRADDEVKVDYVILGKDSSSYTENEITEVFKLKNNEVAVVTEKEHIRVIQRFDILADEKDLKDYDQAVRADLKGDEFTDYIEELAGKLEVEINKAALKKYKPSKVKTK